MHFHAYVNNFLIFRPSHLILNKTVDKTHSQTIFKRICKYIYNLMLENMHPGFTNVKPCTSIKYRTNIYLHWPNVGLYNDASFNYISLQRIGQKSILSGL